MKQVPDRKKLRRKYLQHKGKTFTALGTLTVVVVASLAVACFFLVLTIVTAFQVAMVSKGTEPQRTFDLLRACIGPALITMVSLLIAEVSNDIRTVVVEQAARIPVVPPVTPDNLPADEILVRGSEEPPIVQSEVLLRAVRPGQETPKEELLRSSPEKDCRTRP